MILGYLIQGRDRKELGTEVCLIGRDLACDIVLSDELLEELFIWCHGTLATSNHDGLEFLGSHDCPYP